MIRLSDNRLAFRFESREFSGPFLAERESGGALTLWPLTNAAWRIGCVAPESVVMAYYKVATEAFGLADPGVTPCRTTNDPINTDMMASSEIEALVAVGVLLPSDEPEDLRHELEEEEYLQRRRAATMNARRGG